MSGQLLSTRPIHLGGLWTTQQLLRELVRQAGPGGVSESCDRRLLAKWVAARSSGLPPRTYGPRLLPELSPKPG